MSGETQLRCKLGPYIQLRAVYFSQLQLVVEMSGLKNPGSTEH